MKPNYYTNFIDEERRIKLVKNAKEKVYWISYYFSEKEKEAIHAASNFLGSEKVQISSCEKNTINDEGYCFSFNKDNRRLDIKLHPKKKMKQSDGILVVDNAVYIYISEYEMNKPNAIEIKDIQKIELNELIESFKKGETIQLVIAAEQQSLIQKTLPVNNNEAKYLGGNTGLDIEGKINIKVDVVLEEIQAKMKKIDIKASGIKADIKNIEINDTLDIVGKLDKEIDERLIIRWKIFGNDYKIKEEYKMLNKTLDEIKDKYTINLNSSGRFILERNRKSFEDDVENLKKRLKNNYIEVIQEKITESMIMLEDFVDNIHLYATKESSKLKVCSDFELVNIKEKVKSKFPKVYEIANNSNIEIKYSDISKEDLKDRKLSEQLMKHLSSEDMELYENLKKIAAN